MHEKRRGREEQVFLIEDSLLVRLEGPFLFLPLSHHDKVKKDEVRATNSLWLRFPLLNAREGGKKVALKQQTT